MNQTIYTHLYVPDTLPVNVKYENLKNLYNYEDNSIDNIMITDILDYHTQDMCEKIFTSICNKVKIGGSIQIQSIDLSRLAISLASGEIDITTAKVALYPMKQSIYTLHDIEQLLLKNNFMIVNKRYINVIEYFVSAQKNEQ